jgi:MFS family permease
MFVLAYAFLVTYQAYYLLEKIGSAKAEVPQQIFLSTMTQSVVVVAASLIGGKLSDRTGRRKIFVLTASVVYGVALFAIAIASNFNGFLVGMAIGGLGFGIYVAVELALVVDVLPDKNNAAKDLGVFNMAGALPFPSRQGSRRPSWRSAAAATPCCTGWPGSAPSSEPSPSCP